MSNLSLRLISAAVLILPVLALVIWSPPSAFSAVAVLLAAVAGLELGSITLPDELLSRKPLVALLSAFCCAAVAAGTYIEEPTTALHALVFALLPLGCLIFMLGRVSPARTVPAALATCAGSLYFGGLWGCLSLLRSTDPDHGWRWVLLLLVATVLCDTLAYTFGRAFGRHKMAPRISPAKTWEGAFGGVLGVLAAVALAKAILIESLGWSDLVLLGVPLAIACQLGDLIESFIKRGFGAKDSGKLIPGHGGLLDRCDGLLLGAPVVYLFSLFA
ncbi:MAG: phosphatidate cytidylyltransferase [Polyangia bacterium]